MKLYDYCIVGAGPTGLTIATYLKSDSILIIDKNPEIGGCHRVTRDSNNRIHEHGPRIYSSSFVNMKKVLTKIGLNFDNLFVEYTASISKIGSKTFGEILTAKEIAILTYYYFFPGQKMVAEITSNFSEKSRDYLNRVCLLTDGAGADRYPVRKFMNLVNQHTFYKLYQPKDPNDIGIFNHWQSWLEDKNVTFAQDEILAVSNDYIVGKQNKYFAKKYIFAVPLYNFDMLLYGKDMHPQTKYNDIINVMFWYREHYDLSENWGFPVSEWGITYIPLTDYMKSLSGTSISICITMPDSKSSVTNKTARETKNEIDLFEEIHRQIGLNLPRPDEATVYVRNDTSYINSDFKKISSKTIYPNVFTVGTHNGENKYDFTSFESAVENALHFVDESVDDRWELNDLLYIILGVVTLGAIYYVKKKSS